MKIPEGDGMTLTEQVSPDYASMVYAMDENVGRLLKRLEELELDENTVVIFTSDNGGLTTLPPQYKLPPTSVRPLRAGKGWLYEGGIRVPLIMKIPGITKAALIEVPVVSQDLFPTILSLAGITPATEPIVDGKDLSPLLKGAEPFENDTLYWHFPHYHGSAWKPGAAIRAGDWKLIQFYEDDRIELYNLKEDIGESTDLSERYPEKLSELRQLLHDWQQKMGAKFLFQNPNHNTR